MDSTAASMAPSPIFMLCYYWTHTAHWLLDSTYTYQNTGKTNYNTYLQEQIRNSFRFIYTDSSGHFYSSHWYWAEANNFANKI